jgi:AcrB/AcrD/AcrF family
MRHTLPTDVVGPGFNDEFGDVFGIIYGVTADGFTHRELKDHADDIRSRLMQVPDVAKVEILGAQEEKIYVEFSMQQLAGLGIDWSALIAALAAQNIVSPSGVLQTGNESLTLRVSGAFESEQDILGVNFVANGRLVPRCGSPRMWFPSFSSCARRACNIRQFTQRGTSPAARHRPSSPGLCRSAAADVSRQRPAGDRHCSGHA